MIKNNLYNKLFLINNLKSEIHYVNDTELFVFSFDGMINLINPDFIKNNKKNIFNELKKGVILYIVKTPYIFKMFKDFVQIQTDTHFYLYKKYKNLDIYNKLWLEHHKALKQTPGLISF